MPRYDFRCPDCGATTERNLSRDAFVEHTEVCACGSEMRRHVPVPFCHAGVNAVAKFQGMYPVVSNRLPRFMPGARHDAGGRPIIESRRHERELFAAGGFVRE